MSREVRRVPADWKGKFKEDGREQPHYDQPFHEAARQWKEEFAKWEAGERPSYWTEGEDPDEYWEWEGMPPDSEYYRPDWPDEIRTHLMMYQTTSEGTPISPAFEKPEDLARWLADNGASAFAGMTATYEQWLATIMRGSAMSAAWSPATGFVSGVGAESTRAGKPVDA